jgi:Zn finger protein HypA/HybF involved in hydrogenase expression
MEEAKVIAHYTRVKVKCLKCSLHFLICTVHAGRHLESNLRCPECGQHSGAFCVWSEIVEGLISDEIPGNSKSAD